MHNKSFSYSEKESESNDSCVDFVELSNEHNSDSSSNVIQAPSTRIRIFLKTHLFLSVLGSRPHGDGVFNPEWIFLKTSFSCSRVDG